MSESVSDAVGILPNQQSVRRDEHFSPFVSEKEGATSVAAAGKHGAWAWYSELRTHLRRWAEDHKSAPDLFPAYVEYER